MSGSFSQAIDAYERFSKQAGKKVAAGYEVQTFINQCSTSDGAVKPAVTSLPVTRKEAEVKDMVPVVTEKPVMTGNAGTEKESVTVRPDNEGAGVAGKKTEAVSVKPQQKIAEAAVSVTGRGTVPVVRGDTSGIPAEQFRILGEALEHPEQADSLLLALEGNMETNEEVQPLLPEPVKETGQVSLFEMKAGQAYTEASPVQIDPAMPEGLIYTIQIAAFRNNVAPSLFRGLYPVYGKRRQGSEAVYYYTGLFRRPDDARHVLPEARGAGFSDAFIIAMMDGTQVSMERAALLEKEWGARPLTGTSLLPALKSSGGSDTGNQTSATAAAGGNTTQANQADTGQPVPVVTLSFRAEVMRISKPVKPEVIQKIELLAGTRGLDMIKNSNGETVFLIGNFITFESADDYVSLLIRNGYSDARVAAWVGMQEIPVEAARELLKKMPDD
jgi:hypothetical protein